MAKLSKEAVKAELTNLKVEFDENAEYSDLCELLKVSKPAETKTEETQESALPTTTAEVKKELGMLAARPVPQLTDVQKMEQKIRRFIKKDGGWCKGVTNKDKEIVNALLKKLGREKIEWDFSIALKGQYV